MLAYVFWHTSRIDRADYENRLAAFQEALASHEPEGFIRSVVFVIEQPLPWSPPGKTVYEDWYFVRDFTALGRLNEEAVSGPRKTSHLHVAAAANWGTAGLYLFRSGSHDIESARYVSWLGKPAGVSYPDFYSGLRPGLDLWQRQMTLGPSPEFCMHSSEPTESEHEVSREIVPLWSHPRP